MNLFKLLLITIFILINATLFSRQRALVMAPSGIVLRATPNTSGNKLLLIPYKSDIWIISNSIKEDIFENITSKWYLVSCYDINHRFYKGWVFGGFLKLYSDEPYFILQNKTYIYTHDNMNSNKIGYLSRTSIVYVVSNNKDDTYSYITSDSRALNEDNSSDKKDTIGWVKASDICSLKDFKPVYKFDKYVYEYFIGDSGTTLYFYKDGTFDDDSIDAYENEQFQPEKYTNKISSKFGKLYVYKTLLALLRAKDKAFIDMLVIESGFIHHPWAENKLIISNEMKY